MRSRIRRTYSLTAALLGLAGLAGGWYGVHKTFAHAPHEAPASAASRTPATATSGPVADALAAAGLLHDGAVDAAAVRALLAEVPADTGAATPPYDRAKFGPSWADTDHNGCDQRNDVLKRDLTAITYTSDDPGCAVATGHLEDAYTGRSIDFARGVRTSAAVQVDHLAPLGWIWAHGGAAWTPERREQIATDLNNLQAVDGPTNGAKSDQGPATWLPPNTGYQCLYVTRFTYVLSTYQLTLDTADRQAIDHTLDTCH